ncbi:MAG: low molecular weight protein arginine phosphatase [Kurthia sp.]|nr:low molecular weight protein arginine phosphatase [Candidatus Kurthia equi]
MQIYFICTGNTCRSPMAEAILKSRKIRNLEVRSAGIYTQNGGAMSPNAKAVLREHGIEENHQSSMVDLNYMEQADVVLTMTSAHMHALVQYFPQMANKIFTLSEYVKGQTTDVSDPYGGSIEVYRQTFEELSKSIDALQKKILEE